MGAALIVVAGGALDATRTRGRAITLGVEATTLGDALAAGASVTVIGSGVGVSVGTVAGTTGLGTRARRSVTANTIATAIIAREASDARAMERGEAGRDGGGSRARKSPRTSSVALAGYLSPLSMRPSFAVFSMANRRRHGALRWRE